MKPSTQRIVPVLGGDAAQPARVHRLRAAPSAIDGTHALRPALGEEAWPWHLVPADPPAHAGGTEPAASALPPSLELYHDARRRQAALLGDMIAAPIRAIWAALLRAGARYRQAQEARATYDALCELDDRTLHDLGMARDEIRSVAAELTGQAEHSRRLARPTWPVRPSLFDLLFRQ